MVVLTLESPKMPGPAIARMRKMRYDVIKFGYIAAQQHIILNEKIENIKKSCGFNNDVIIIVVIESIEVVQPRKNWSKNRKNCFFLPYTI